MNLLEMNPHETRYIPLIGSPIGGSTASYLYNQIFAAFGINAMSYPVEVKKGELPEFLAAVKFMNTPGCVLTSPHKQDIIQYIDDVDEASRVFRSVNTLRFREDGRIEGHGLDGKGVIGAFDDNGVDLKGKEVVMLGAGGISGIFATELANRGIRKLTILNRTVDKARYVTETLAARTPVETACGEYTPEILETLQQTSAAYARGASPTHSFRFPEKWYAWQPTCHYAEAETPMLIKRFLSAPESEDLLLHIFGHSYEMTNPDRHHGWVYFESLLKLLSGRQDVVYATNSEAMRRIRERN